MRAVKLLPFFILIVLLQACLETRQIEESAIINTRGVDLIDEGEKRMIETTIIPYIFDPHAPDMTSLLIGRGHTIKEARIEAEKQSPYPLVPGKISIEFYGKEAAESGILPFLNTLVRDATVSDIMQLAVTNQTAKELLEVEQESVKLNRTEYLEDLMKKEVKKGTLPRNTLEFFTRLVQQVGIDPILPVIDVVNGKPTLTSAAVFREDRYVGSISIKESFMANLLRQRMGGAPLDVGVPLENYLDEIAYQGEATEMEDTIFLSLMLNTGKGKIKIVDASSLTFKADITMKLELLETSIPMNIKSEDTSRRFERDIEKYFVREYEKLFAKLQEVNSDVLGLGRRYIASRKGSKTTDKEWMEKYQDASMEFDIDVTIINFGAID
ncbi:Ger(x)C family spore germination protein [Oceanobacillus alkalisoli]|uniref:Ger(x)C family spore germination protein n=1 Tax=Oceanobacillus alkalisoli TaxID=2925113 RepID=UPI001EE4DC5E|nr:Ger(x)C family spore germination protein [Oceanobacillus alkalisoli]MCG5105161.1 Ger(x)C family spore germination protein [Oceanobacillus alkalisoli]